jgi:hypothetical protein
MANAYTNAISDNVKRTVLHKLNNGECIRKAPIGYLNVRDEQGKSNVVVDKARALLIQEMFKMYATGSYSLGDLAKFAEHNGFTNNFYKHGKAKTLSVYRLIAPMEKRGMSK